MNGENEIAEARRFFPAGLVQPEGGFRFSADALHLAAFASEFGPKKAFFADLGTGCGAVALALLLNRDGWKGAGLELMPEAADAAVRNTERLGMEDRFRVIRGDVSDTDVLRAMRRILAAPPPPEAEPAFLGFPMEAPDSLPPAASLPLFDAVICNPPWRLEGRGRLPPSALRRKALFGDEKTLGRFFSAADSLLRQGGVFCCVCGAERTADMLESLPGRLHPELLRYVFTGRPSAEFVLMKAVKNGRGELRVEKLDAASAFFPGTPGGAAE